MHTYKKAIEMVKVAKEVYGWVNFTHHDGHYIKLHKTDVVNRLKEDAKSMAASDDEWKDEVRVRLENGVVWIG